MEIVGEDKGLAGGELNTPMDKRCKKFGGFVIDRGRVPGLGGPLTIGKLETAGDEIKDVGPRRESELLKAALRRMIVGVRGASSPLDE